jgi:Pex14 N-terminal domain
MTNAGKQQPELIDKARSFLASPEIMSADIAAKKDFLKSKGLREQEIDQLMSSNEVCKLTDLARFK